MTAQEFITRLLLEKYELAAICTVLSFLVIFYVLKKKIHSVIDPLLLSAVSLAFSISVALFLFLCGEVDKEKITYFVIGQTLFLAIIYIVFPNRKKLNNKCVIKTVGANTKMLFVICFLIFIFVSLYSFSINGIPLFQTTRYDVNIDNSSGILGFLSRMKNSVVLFIAIYAYYLFDAKRYYISITIILTILIVSFLFGSKAFITTLIFPYYFYRYFYTRSLPHISVFFIVIILISPVLLLMFSFLGQSGEDSIVRFGIRIAEFGDIYWNAYPNNIIDEISYSNPLSNMTCLFWAPFRHIIDASVGDKTLTTGGGLIAEIVLGYPPIGAPNSPCIIMSWIYYKWAGLLFIFIFFLFVSFLYRRAYLRKCNTLVDCCLKGLLIHACLTCLLDIYIIFYELLQIILFYTIYKFVWITNGLLKKNKFQNGV